MFFVYILYSKNFDRYYIGMTSDVEKRVKDYNSGRTKSTKPYKPWEVIHKEKFQDRLEARKREKYLKTAAGRRWRNQNIHPK